jgi:hypothetical protein
LNGLGPGPVGKLSENIFISKTRREMKASQKTTKGKNEKEKSRDLWSFAKKIAHKRAALHESNLVIVLLNQREVYRMGA